MYVASFLRRVHRFLPVAASSIMAASLFNSGCTREKSGVVITYSDRRPSASNEIHFGVHPLHNPGRLFEVFGPLTDLLNAQIPDFRFIFEASTNYRSFEEKLQHRELEVALPNPYEAVKALQYGYNIFAKMGDDENFRGLIIVRKDSDIKTFSDLKNKTISYPAPTALAATMMPQFFLYRHGINIAKDVNNLYVGSQESAILNAYLEASDAACTWPPPWIAFVKNNPDKAKDLEVRWETESLVNNAVIIRDDIDLKLRDEIRDILLHLHESEQGRNILQMMELSKFETANEQTYQIVKDFIARFSKDVRNPEEEK